MNNMEQGGSDLSEPAYQEQMYAAKVGASNQLRAFTVRDRIIQQMKEIKQRENQLNEFLKLLDNNPDTEKILNLSRNLL